MTTFHTVPRVLASCWRNHGDEGRDPDTAACGRHMLPGDGLRFCWVALPARCTTPLRQVRSRLTEAYSGCPWSGPWDQIDVGPWWDGTRGDGKFDPALQDRYWVEGRRPLVETRAFDARGRRDNGCAIDLTPRAMAELLVTAGRAPGVSIDEMAQRIYHAPIELVVDLEVMEPDSDHLSLDRPSEHFSWSEVSHSPVAEELCISNRVPDDLRPGVAEFARAVMEPLREAIGRPLRYGVDWTSWYRCEALNRRVGGSPTSGHLTGRKVDVPRTLKYWDALHRARFQVPVVVRVEPDHYDVGIDDQGKPGISRIIWIKGAEPRAQESS